jgi:hypothetical protein
LKDLFSPSNSSNSRNLSEETSRWKVGEMIPIILWEQEKKLKYYVEELVVLKTRNQS